MQEYVRLPSRHMEFLIHTLDGHPVAFEPPDLPALPTTADAALVREAVAFLRRTSLPLNPKKQWPPGGLRSIQVKGRIPENHRAQPGKVLCLWGDAGWGALVRDGKYRDGHYADDLVNACAALVREWKPQPAPAWVTCIPSRHHASLVPDFARRLAAALHLRFDDVLDKIADRPPQKEMENWIQQARNVDGSLAVKMSPLPAGPLLLVDDMVDSGWTLTVAAHLLTSHGSGVVYPLALASTAHAE
jgi:ATP-dependent DNA helicase RecQ